MVQLVDSFNLSTNVEVLDSLVQVLDGRVLGVTAEDQLGLLGSRTTRVSTTHQRARPSKVSLRQNQDIGKNATQWGERWCVYVVEGWSQSNHAATTKRKYAWHSLVGTVDVVDGQDGQVAIITEITQGNAGAGLELVLVDGLLVHVEGNGHGEDIAIGKATVLADTKKASAIRLLGNGAIGPSFQSHHHIPVIVGLVHESCKARSALTLAPH